MAATRGCGRDQSTPATRSSTGSSLWILMKRKRMAVGASKPRPAPVGALFASMGAVCRACQLGGAPLQPRGARAVLKEATRDLTDRNRIVRQSGSDRARIREVPYPPQVQAVDSAGVRRRRSSLPREICIVSPGTEDLARAPDRDAEVSRGHSRWRETSRHAGETHPAEGPNGPRTGVNGEA